MMEQVNEYGDPISDMCHLDRHDECNEEECNCQCHEADDPNDELVWEDDPGGDFLK